VFDNALRGPVGIEHFVVHFSFGTSVVAGVRRAADLRIGSAVPLPSQCLWRTETGKARAR
jgi:hypothetical protein